MHLKTTNKNKTRKITKPVFGTILEQIVQETILFIREGEYEGEDDEEEPEDTSFCKFAGTSKGK
jgi:hypothetical protein